MEILTPVSILSLKKTGPRTLEMRLQIAQKQHLYSAPYQSGEFRLFDFPEELRRVLRQQPATSWRLLQVLTDFLERKPIALPLSLTDVEAERREAA